MFYGNVQFMHTISLKKKYPKISMSVFDGDEKEQKVK